MNEKKETKISVPPKVKKGLIFLAIFIVGLLVGALTMGKRSGEPTQPQVLAKTQKKQETTWWTCSMHPQIHRPGPGKCPICGMDLIPAGSDEGGGMRNLTISAAASALMDVEIFPAERRFATAEIRMVGKIEYDETRIKNITTWIPGRLERLYVDYTGVPVQQGDHLMDIYSPELLSAQEELLQALKALRETEGSSLAIMRQTTMDTVASAREKLRLWGLKPEQIEQIEQTGKVAERMTIYSPMGGIVIQKNALEGMYVNEGTQIYQIADLSRVWAKLDAYESDLQWLRYGQKVEFTTASWPGEVFTGTIAFIDPVLNETTRTAKVRVNVDNLSGKLKPEMFVKSLVKVQIADGGQVVDTALAGKWISPMHPEIVKDEPGFCDICGMPLVRAESLGYVTGTAGQSRRAGKPLVIPVSAALVTGTRAVVYVKVPAAEGKAAFEGREIVLGPRAGDYYLVRHGLAEGEQVVVRGNFKIDSALQIQAKPSMMTPDGGGGGMGHAHVHRDASPDQMTEMANREELPAVVHHQLLQILETGREIPALLKQQNLPAVQKAFEKLSDQVKQVDMTQLSDETHKIWMEAAMRLGNDAFEGGTVQTLDAAGNVAKSLAANLNFLQERLGIMPSEEKEQRPVVSAAFRKLLTELNQAYAGIQQSLAADQLEPAKDAAQTAEQVLQQSPEVELAREDQSIWQQSSVQLEQILTDLRKSDSLETARKHFHLLSQEMIALAGRFGSALETPLYVLHCPMAFDGTGADWLQTDKTTANPYFGSAMPRCGNIKDMIAVKSIWQETHDHE